MRDEKKKKKRLDRMEMLMKRGKNIQYLDIKGETPAARGGGGMEICDFDYEDEDGEDWKRGR